MHLPGADGRLVHSRGLLPQVWPTCGTRTPCVKAVAEIPRGGIEYEHTFEEVLETSGEVDEMSIELWGQPTVDDAMAVLGALQDEVETLSGVDASDRLSRVTALAAQLDAYRVSLVDTIRTSEVWRETDPNGTPASYLRNEHLMDQRQAKSDLRTATAFTRFPELAQACRAGRVSRAKVDVILAVGLKNQHREDALGDFIAIFVDLAARVTISDLKRTLELWADQIDPLPSPGDGKDAHARRELRIHQLGDGVKLDGFFGPDQGMRIMVAINGALDLHRRENPDAKGAAQADNANAEHGNYRITNSTGSQRADAFIDAIINPILQAGSLPTSGGAPANICVTVPLERLQSPDSPVDVDELKDRLANGTLRHHSAAVGTTNGPGNLLINAAKAQQLSCDATIQRIILDPVGKPLDIGRRTRVIPEQIRTALVIRDGGCRFPFCDKPAGWTEGHHIQHWSQGGPTSLDNLILLCSRHHHQVHSERIPITMGRNGIPRVALEHRYSDRL